RNSLTSIPGRWLCTSCEPHRRPSMDKIARLEAELAAAQAQLQRAQEACLQGARGGLEEWRRADEACLAAERALALARGEETALACEWALPWDVGAPCPHAVASEGRALLWYLAN